MPPGNNSIAVNKYYYCLFFKVLGLHPLFQDLQLQTGQAM